MKEVFRLTVEAFEKLADFSSRSFKKAEAVLDNVCKVRSSMVMLDLECYDLVLQIFRTFLGIIRVSVSDPKTLSINPYDPDTLKALEKAIVSSPLGLNPRLDGNRLVASIPAMTKGHIQEMCKIVTKSSEVVKQSIRATQCVGRNYKEWCCKSVEADYRSGIHV